ncbi:MAG: histidine phosphatase family protein, partial [Proteobacteria bacterium]|nr:histidine phosphatase family protein [Pseudomonadota bacterium]
MKFPPLYLLRHGQTEWNAAGRFQGQKNSDLTEVGRGHAAAQGRLLAPVLEQFPDIDIYASPLGRVCETFEIALGGHDRTPVFNDDLKEIAFGDWENLTRQEIKKGWPDIFNDAQTDMDLFLFSPDGENYDDMYTRCHRFLSSLTKPSVVFSHGITIAFMRTIARDLSYEG